MAAECRGRLSPNSSEERILTERVRWRDKDLDNPDRADQVGVLKARALAKAYVESSSLGRLEQALAEVSPDFVAVDRPGGKVTAVATGVMRRLYAGHEWARPRIIGFSVLENDPNVGIAHIEAESVWPAVPLPQDPPCLFFVDPRRRNDEVLPFIAGYDRGMRSGVGLLSERTVRNVLPRRRLQKAAGELNPDQKGSAAQQMLKGGVPTDLARGIAGIMHHPIEQAAPDILAPGIAASFAFWARLELIGYNG